MKMEVSRYERKSHINTINSITPEPINISPAVRYGNSPNLAPKIPIAPKEYNAMVMGTKKR
jgi:hypothetical protein